MQNISNNHLARSKNEYKPKIIIFGVGGAGGNAINNMISSDLKGVEFVAANTDAQSLENSLAQNKIQLGINLTKGLGAGSFPECGRDAAEENIEEINNLLEGVNMVFISAGMGGGTGTGAAPVIAKLAREKNILTVGVVTKPFYFEGSHRMDVAEDGVEDLKKHVDTLIVIPNQNLFRIANEQTTFESAFKMADAVLHAGVRGVTDLITMPGIVNLDFADIRTVMTKMGRAMMGTGEASGENRAVIACEEAISNPLLDDVSIKGAKGVLVNMTGGTDMTLFEADAAVTTIKKEVDPKANIIFGTAFDENMKGLIRVSVVATGIDGELAARNKNIEQGVNKIHYNDERITQDWDTDEKRDRIPDYQSNLICDDDNNPQDDKSYYEDIEGSDDDIGSSYEDQDVELLNNESDDHSADDDSNVLSKDSFFMGQSDNDNIDENYHDNIQSQDYEQDIIQEKENSGFSLFGFMNNKKNKSNKNNKIISQDNKGKEYQPISEQNNKIINDSDDFFNSNAMSDDSNSTSDLNDNIVNVPAFFRKKNK